MSRLSFVVLSFIVIAGSVGLSRQQAFSQEQPAGGLVVADDPLGASAALANQLISYGRENKSPEAMVTAAMILAKLPAVDVDEKGEFENKPSASQNVEIESILKEALAMREGDATIKELVTRTRESLKEKTRGFGIKLPKVNDIIRRLRVQIPRNSKIAVTKVTKKKGEVIAASIPVTGTLAITPASNENIVLASGKNSVQTEAPKDGEYTVILGAGPLAIDTTMSLR